MRQYEAELVVDSQCQLGEGPVWDARTRSIYWVDITGKKLLQYFADNGDIRSIDLEQQIGCFALRDDGTAVAAGSHGFQYMNLSTGALQAIHDPEAHLPNNRFNDGKCDSRGRFLAGSITSDSSPNGALYVMHPSGEINLLLDQIACSNGIAWSRDETKMYYIDSLAYAVHAYDYDAETCGLSNKQAIITYSIPGIVPDGMTWDQEGMLWIAEWGGWNVTRWNPATGERLAKIQVPCTFVTSCAFAGDGSDELYITTARGGLTEEQLAEQPHAGGLFRVKTGVAGVGGHLFKAQG
ncbi:SMP-30/gluconolactonase/LRE family protein [Paenibacillus marinisediminis]